MELKTKGKVVRHRSVDNVLKEIAEVKNKYPLRVVKFIDDTFNLNKEWLKEFCDKYKRQINLPFVCNLRADLITLEEGIKTVADLKKLVTQEDDTMKCGICHSNDCMMCKGPAFACGVFCPECKRFFHQHCCAGWAESL